MVKIAIRADGGSNIGMGHIMRTLVLARELSKTNEVFYVCEDLEKYKKGIEEVEKYFRVVKINNNFNELINIDADVLITDSYSVNEEYFSVIKKHFSICGYIDDMNLCNFKNLDFVINQNYNAENQHYIGGETTSFFCGSNYLMLRDEFRNNNKIKINKEIRRICITMGGSDVANVTPRILNYLIDFNGKIDVIVTKSFSNLDYINSIVDKSENINLHVEPSMISILGGNDVLISAGGSTLYEACSIGIPTLAVVVATNQIELCKNMHNNGLIISMGHEKYLNKEIVINSLSEIIEYDVRKDMQLKQQQINPLGVFNVIEGLKGLGYID